jgi:tetratricopeptide (TPR) repeat protein
MQGRFDEARDLLARYRAILADLGLRVTAASAAETHAIVEFLAADPAAAEGRLRWGVAELQRMGVTTTRANLAALLAQAAHAQGRHEEALEWSEAGERAAPDDLYPQVLWRSARAKALARLGRADEGERLAVEAVGLAEQTDFLNVRADALVDLAEVLRERGRAADAKASVRAALELYERKGNLVSAARARETL